MDETTDVHAAVRDLLARKLRESGLSARKAAEGMSITDTRLRHIINGYQPVGRGQRIDVVAPTDTLASIALALNATPDEVAAAGRPDAAEMMRKILGERAMENYGDTSREWLKILAEHEEIREWASEGIAIFMPPDAILEMRAMANIPRGHRKSPLDHDVEGLNYALRCSGLTQKGFAEALGKSQGLISEILKGTRNATPALIGDMARVLNCPRVVLERKRTPETAA